MLNDNDNTASDDANINLGRDMPPMVNRSGEIENAQVPPSPSLEVNYAPPMSTNQAPAPMYADQSASPINPPNETAPVMGMQQSPVQSVTPLQASVLPPHPSNKKKKGLVIGLLVAGFVLLLGGGSVLAYTTYQSSDKVVFDGFVNMIIKRPTSADGNLRFTSDQADVRIAMDMKASDKVANGKITLAADIPESKLKIEGSVNFAAESNGNGYVRFNDIDKLAETVVDTLVDAQAAQYQDTGMTMTPQQIAEAKRQALASFSPFIDKINNQWIKFSADADDEEISKEQKCVTDTIKKLEGDAGMRNEIADAYKNNRFIVVKEELGLKDGSYGYVLDLDEKKAEEFGKVAEKTKIIAELNKCSDDPFLEADDFASNPSSDKTSTNSRVELWVSQWSHQITSMSLQTSSTEKDTDDASATGDISFDYKTVTGVSVPKDAIDSKVLMDDIQSLLMGSAASATSQTDTLSI